MSNQVLDSQRLRLHHYMTQSMEHMSRRSRAGEADLYGRRRDKVYWHRTELVINKERDTTLAERSVCRSRGPDVA